MKNTENIHTKTVEVTLEYIKKPLKFNESNVLQINIKYPDVKILSSGGDFVKAEKKINIFYDAIIKSFTEYCEKRLYKNAAAEFMAKKADETEVFKPFGAVMTFDVTYNKQDLLCVYLDINIYSGKGRGNIARKSQIWKTDKGELLSPEHFIKFNYHVKQKICGYICEIMEKKARNGEEYYIKSDMQSVYRYFNMNNFYMSENGYSFFFPQNTIASPESGILSFEIPEKVIKE